MTVGLLLNSRAWCDDESCRRVRPLTFFFVRTQPCLEDIQGLALFCVALRILSRYVYIDSIKGLQANYAALFSREKREGGKEDGLR